jgi:hypothetical protein
MSERTYTSIYAEELECAPPENIKTLSHKKITLQPPCISIISFLTKFKIYDKIN